jgi:Sulfotransferase family
MTNDATLTPPTIDFAESQSQRGPAGIKAFIAGAPRTGTSILVFGLKAVFDLPGHGESHVLPAFNQMIHALFRYWEPFKKVKQSVVNETMLAKMKLEDVERHVHGYIRKFYMDSFPDGSWVDKTPSPPGVYALPLAEQVFPDARLIVTQRNGIEVVSSHIKKFNATFEEACEVWISAMLGLTRIRPLCKNLLVVDQYDFSNVPNHVAAAISNHLGRPEKAEALAQYLLSERVELSSAHDWSKRLRLEDMSWSNEQKQFFRDKCGEMMNSYGYAM